jgi:hypothetical protein
MRPNIQPVEKLHKFADRQAQHPNSFDKLSKAKPLVN